MQESIRNMTQYEIRCYRFTPWNYLSCLWVLVASLTVAGCYLELPLPRTNPLDPKFTGAATCKSDTDCGSKKACRKGQCQVSVCVPSQYIGSTLNNNFANISDGDVLDVLFHPTKPLLVSASANGTVKIWSQPSLKLTRILVGHEQGTRVLSLALNEDATLLASGADDNTIRIWESPGGKEVAVLKGHTGGVTSVNWFSSKHIISSSFDKTIRFWDINTKKETRASLTVKSVILSAKLNPAGSMLAASTQRGEIFLWQGSELKPIIPDAGAGQGLSHPTAVYDISWSLDGKRLVTAPDDGGIIVWDVTTLKEAVRMRTSDLKGAQGHPVGVDWSPNGLHAAVSNSTGRIDIWNTQTGALVTMLKDRETGNMPRLRYHPDGRSLAAAAGGTSIGLWKCP